MLHDDPSIDASTFEVAVQDGVVRLTGEVPDRDPKRLAEDVVLQATGVVDVDNELRVVWPSEHPGHR